MLLGKIYISLSVLLLLLFGSIPEFRAQAPFIGGSGHGYGEVNEITYTDCEPISISPYDGGSSNGYSSVNQINSLCTPISFLPYLGGTSNGFSRNLVNNSITPCFPVVFNPYNGGVSNGFSRIAEIITPCKPTILSPYDGSNGNGYFRIVFNNSNPPCKATPIDINAPFAGGSSNGFAQVNEINTPCKPTILNPYLGSTSNGFSQIRMNNSLSPCFPIVYEPYSGGTSNGFSFVSQVSIVCKPEVVLPYLGGSANGFSRRQEFSSLSIVQQPPVTTEACHNATITINLSSSSSNIVYQWQQSNDGGNSFFNLENNSDFSGVDTDELTINNSDLNMDGYIYRALVAKPGCASAFSDVSLLSVAPQPVSPSIIKNPNTLSVCQGDNVLATFTSGSGGNGSVNDIFEYSTDFGSSWNTYIPSDLIETGSLQGYEILKIRAFRTASGLGCQNSTINEVNWTVAGEGFWLGIIDNDWHVEENWGCGIIPTTTTDVVVPSFPIGNRMPNVLSNNPAYCRNLDIESSASVSIFFNNDLSIYGNLNNDGVASFGLGKVKFAANSLQLVNGNSTSTFAFLDLDNSNNPVALKLNQNFNVTDVLTVITGIIDLNGHDIDLGNRGLLQGETETTRITGASGEIKSNIILNANTTYSNIAGLGIDIVTGEQAPGLSVVNRGHHTYSIDFENYGIQRYFRIEPTINTNLDATLRLHYFDAELAPGTHAEHNLITWRSADNGVNWEGQFFPLNLSNNSESNWVQQTSIDAFSIWTLSDWQIEPLPIQLLHFNAVPNGNVVDLEWVTASETNNHFFTIERSPDIIDFSDILSQPGAGNSNIIKVYNDVDKYPLYGISYYRLRQTDFDGTTSHSNIVPVFFDKNQTEFDAFVEMGKNFNISYNANKKENVLISIYDMTGRIIIEDQVSVTSGNNNFLIKNPGLAKGLYIVKLVNNEKQFSKKLFIH